MDLAGLDGTSGEGHPLAWMGAGQSQAACTVQRSLGEPTAAGDLEGMGRLGAINRPGKLAGRSALDLPRSDPLPLQPPLLSLLGTGLHAAW